MTRFSPLSRRDLSLMGVAGAGQASAAARASARKQVKGETISGNVTAPGFEVSDVFSYQSYFDDTLLEKALFRQPPNQPIVPSTLSEPVQIAGHGLALHPSSETPVAVQFMTGAQQGASQTYRLKPGEMIRPQGVGIDAEGNEVPGFFTGFQWGLPFGWLGGGNATLVVLRSPDSKVEWATDHNEVVYHRMRVKIVDPTALPVNAGPPAVYSGPLNWPQRFPWPAAVFGASSLTQRGQPALSVAPTRTALSLRLASLTNPADMRVYFIGADVWAQTGPTAQGVGTINLGDIRADDITWGTWAQQAGAPAPFSSAFQDQLLTGALERYAANAGAVQFASTAASLQNQYVDVVRWGRL